MMSELPRDRQQKILDLVTTSSTEDAEWLATELLNLRMGYSG
ncbi:MAG TPA: hypothetical protein V6D08_05050 [Candidatus Obscuribacterales bacterium]